LIGDHVPAGRATAGTALAIACFAAWPSVANGVVGGHRVARTAFPWFVDVGCGGVLVAPDRVLTAAHCVPNASELARARLTDGRRRTVSGAALHPGFVRERLAGTQNPEGNDFDVALLLLSRPVDDIAPLRLAGSGGVRPGRRARVLGAGFSSAPPPDSPLISPAVPARASRRRTLRAATLMVISDSRCDAYYRRVPGPYRTAFRRSTMFCAVDPDRRRPYRAPCVGDSGGPLLAGQGNASRLLGIVSWAGRCGADGDPPVFADVAALRSFIENAAPAVAPLAGIGASSIVGPVSVGKTVTCQAPPWRRAPDRVVYQWLAGPSSSRLRTVQRDERATYVVRRRDGGGRLACAPLGATAGGLDSPRASQSVEVTE